MENSAEVSQKIKTRTSIWLSNSTSVYISKIIKIWISKGYLHSYFHCSSIYISQSMKTNWMSVSRWMVKENAVVTCNWILFIFEKERNPVICKASMNLEGIILNEISQMQKDKYHIIPLTWRIWNNLIYSSSL